MLGGVFLRFNNLQIWALYEWIFLTDRTLHDKLAHTEKVVRVIFMGIPSQGVSRHG